MRSSTVNNNGGAGPGGAGPGGNRRGRAEGVDEGDGGAGARGRDNIMPAPAHRLAHRPPRELVDIENNILDIVNGNEVEIQGQRLLIPDRRGMANPMDEGGGDEGADNVSFIIGPNEPVLIDDDFEGRLLKHFLNYQCVPLGKYTVLCMIALWTLLLLPDTAYSYDIFGYGQVDFVRWGLFLALVMTSVIFTLMREDIERFPPFRILDVRMIQLIIAVGVGLGVDLLLDQLGPAMRIFFFHVKDRNTFDKQVEFIRQKSVSELYYFWIQINMQFCVLSFAFLFAIDLVATFWRMCKRTNIINQVVRYELDAYLVPWVKLLAILLLLNLISEHMSQERQTTVIWTVLLLVASGCFGMTIWKFTHHPEIPLRRPFGILGYLYMEMVAYFQLSMGLALHTILWVSRDVVYGFVPGAFMDSLYKPGVFTGPALFLDQLAKGTPKEEWTRPRLFEPSYELAHGLFFLLALIRHFQLKIYVDQVQERVEREMVRQEQERREHERHHRHHQRHQQQQLQPGH